MGHHDVSLKIRIEGPRGSQQTDHAKRTIRRLQEETHISDVVPQGVPVAMARYMETCDDCGQVYWAANKWASHIGCKGTLKSVGF